MIKTDITVHMLVKNEEQWIWYGLQSVIDYVDKIIIFDTGSSDATVKIIKSISSGKITFFEKGLVNSQQMVYLRNEQIQLTDTSWFLLLDGDEVWPKETIQELVQAVRNLADNIMAIGLHVKMPVGDLFHFQPENAGKYKLAGKTGHYNLRAYRIKPGYKWFGIYPLEAYVNNDGIPVQDIAGVVKLIRNDYWHLTHLTRSSIDSHHKKKYEIGITDSQPKLPEVFYKDSPDFIPSPWVKYSYPERLLAKLLTPALRFKRLFI